MLADATMPSGAKWLIHALGPLAHESITIVHLVPCQVLLESLGSLTARVDPTVWVPFCVILPNFPVDMGKRRGGYRRVTLGDDILTILRGGCQGAGDNNVGDDATLCLGEEHGEKSSRDVTHHYGVDGRMQAQGFTNDTVENREFFHFLICHGAKSPIRSGEMFHLFLVQSLTERRVNRVR